MPIYTEDTAGTVKRVERFYDESEGSLKERAEVWLERPAGTLRRYHDIPELFLLNPNSDLVRYDKFGLDLEETVRLAGDASFSPIAVAATATRRYMADASGAVRVYNSSRLRVSAEEFSIGSGAVSMDVNGSKLYVLRSNKSVSVYSLTSRSEITAEGFSLSANSADLVSIESIGSRIKVVGHLTVGGGRQAVQEQVTENVPIDSNWVHWDYADRWLASIGETRSYLQTPDGLGFGFLVVRPVTYDDDGNISNTWEGGLANVRTTANNALRMRYYGRGFTSAITLVFLQTAPPNETVTFQGSMHWAYLVKLHSRETRTVTRFVTVGGRRRSSIYQYNLSGASQPGLVQTDDYSIQWAQTVGTNIYAAIGFQGGRFSTTLRRFNADLSSSTQIGAASALQGGYDFSIQGTQIFGVSSQTMQVYALATASRVPAAEIDLAGINPPDPLAICKHGSRYYIINNTNRTRVLAYNLSFERTPNDDWNLHSANSRAIDIASDGTYFYVINGGTAGTSAGNRIYIYLGTTKARQASREIDLSARGFNTAFRKVAASSDAVYASQTGQTASNPNRRDVIYKFARTGTARRAETDTGSPSGRIIGGMEWFDDELCVLDDRGVHSAARRTSLSTFDSDLTRTARYDLLRTATYPDGFVFV